MKTSKKYEPIPLITEQISYAQELYSRMKRWQAIDGVFNGLRVNYPNFEPAVTELKFDVINKLYSTNVLAKKRMVAHITSLQLDVNFTYGIELVGSIATLPPTDTDPNPLKFVSFASKFAHFFIDANTFPIFDSLAQNTLAYHLGKEKSNRDNHYEVFYDRVTSLKRQNGLTCSNAELDRYLWLAGQLLREYVGKEVYDNETRTLFKSKEVKSELHRLLPLYNR